MGTWLMKFEVEADLGIEPSLGELVFKHPQGLFEVHLENHQMEPGCKSPSLHAYFLFQADGLDDAAVTGETHCRQFLDVLVFTTGARFRVGRRLCVFDWSADAEHRQGYVYNQFPDPNLPQLVLGQPISSSIELLLSAELVQICGKPCIGFPLACPRRHRRNNLNFFGLQSRQSRDSRGTRRRCQIDVRCAKASLLS